MTRLLLSTVLVTSLAACGSSKSDPTNALEECADPGEIDEATLIAWDFEQSIHEMVQCGNLGAQLNQSLYQAAATLLMNPTQAPEAFSYSDGKFRVEQADGCDAEVIVGVLLRRDPSGEPQKRTGRKGACAVLTK